MLMQALFESISARWMPEDVVKLILEHRADDFLESEKVLLKQALPRYRYSSMSKSFQKPVDLAKQLKVAEDIFRIAAPTSSDPDEVRDYLDTLKASMQMVGTDFKNDRLSWQDRKRLETVPRGHRAYNKRFRLLGRMEKKFGTWLAVTDIRDLAQISKSRLATRITHRDFMQDMNTACFIAYMTARLNKRSMFTFGKQERPYDTIAEMLFKKLAPAPSTANWFAIAHVHPQPEVLERLTEDERGRLLGVWYSVMVRAAKILKAAAAANPNMDLRQLIVRRGDDSSTWNEAAGAFNRAREGWINTLYALGGESLLDHFAPGKALRLMAADVAYGHRVYGDGLEPDTAVWDKLPKPWTVVLDSVRCNRFMIEDVCREFKIEGKGWLAPRPKTVVEFKPTPELVHGVVIESPALAAVLKAHGFFAGPSKAKFSAADLEYQGIYAERT